jgi:hypothetical protein
MLRLSALLKKKKKKKKKRKVIFLAFSGGFNRAG